MDTLYSTIPTPKILSASSKKKRKDFEPEDLKVWSKIVSPRNNMEASPMPQHYDCLPKVNDDINRLAIVEGVKPMDPTHRRNYRQIVLLREEELASPRDVTLNWLPNWG